VDARVVAQPIAILVAATEKDTFRADLYDRLNVVPLAIPPLRARREDIPMLARHFLELAAKRTTVAIIRIENDALAVLAAYSFPGNVRELRNLIERLVILTTPDSSKSRQTTCALVCRVARRRKATGLYTGLECRFRVLTEEAERVICKTRSAHHSGQMAATARALDLERSHLYTKARALGLRGQEKSEPDDEG